ncbi:hypothetical protein PIB30_058587 [Stylosanthes scabra]|uniref:RNase H type-1 domain-containing protein n=1 Tax=Stylosanthes scabra TaxID=79078 RepID=A0ABU6TMF3_9FABA|nr:hypothetical protein [Stylosanthes scabra]
MLESLNMLLNFPSRSQVKVNCDVSVFVDDCLAGFGSMIRDAHGTWLMGCAGSLPLTRNWWVEVRLIQWTTNGVADAMAKIAARLSLPHAEWF